MVAWFAVCAALSWKTRNQVGDGMTEYFLANRTVGGFVSAMTYSATTYSAFMMVGLVGLSYTSGVAVLGFELTYLIGTVFLLTLFAPRYWAAGRAFNLVTPPELLTVRYGSPLTGAAASVLCLVMLIPYASVQLMGMGYLVEILSKGAFPFFWGTAVTAVAAFVFSWWAGLRSVALTDALQAVVMLAASLLLAGWVYFTFFPQGALPTLAGRPDMLSMKWPLPVFVGLTLPWAFFALTNPQVVQRLYVSRNVASLRKMIMGFSVFGLIYTVLCVFLGMSASVVFPGVEKADNAMPLILAAVPAPLALVVAISIMAAAVSTLNSIILTISSMFGRDIVRAFVPDMDEQRELRFCKALIPLLTLACFVFAQFRFGLIAVLSSMASGGLLMQVPAILGAFFWKRATAAGALSSIVAGGCVTGWMYAAGIKPLGQWPPVWGILLSGAVFVSVSLVTKPSPKAGDFLAAVQHEMKGRFTD